MGSGLQRRLDRYAAYLVVHAVLFVAVLAADGGDALWIVLAVASVPLLFAGGPFHADLAVNHAVVEPERSRWRLGFFLVPWSMTAYWLLYVRGRTVD